MFINEVKNIVGLSLKSIRYYEENGLLSPQRNHHNSYRIYTEEDIQKLKVIKFLRELDVPIRELKMLNDGSITLTECLTNRILKIKEYEDKLKNVKNLCEELISQNVSYNDIDISNYFQEIRILNKEGFSMHEVKSNNKKKIIGAITSSILFSSFFIFLIAIIIYFAITEDNLPFFILLFFLIILGLPVFGIYYNLYLRIKEILGGEEDEASKY